jgi:hypothetical protein
MTKSDVIGNLKEYQDFIQLNLKKAKKFAQKSISKSYLTGCTWIMLTENESDITFFYTFRNNDQLLITKNGNVEKAKYEIIVDNNSLLIEKKDIIEHFNIVNFQDDYLILNKLSTEEYLIFANQTKYKDAVKENVLKLLIESNKPIKEIKHKEIERVEKKKISNKNDYSDLKWFFLIVTVIAIISTIFSLTKIANKNSQYNNEEPVEAPPEEEVYPITETTSQLNIDTNISESEPVEVEPIPPIAESEPVSKFNKESSILSNNNSNNFLKEDTKSNETKSSSDIKKLNINGLQYNLRPVKTVKYFLENLSNREFYEAYSLTNVSNWEEKGGYNWFSSVKAYGGVTKIIINNIIIENYDGNKAIVYADYYEYDNTNDSRRWKHYFTVEYKDNDWKITNIK